MAKDPQLLQIGANLRRHRKLRGFTQAALAERAGVSVDMISGVERAVVSPSISSLARIAAAMNLDVVDMMVRVEPARANRFEASLAALVDNLKRDQKVGDVDFLRSVHELLKLRDQKSTDRT